MNEKIFREYDIRGVADRDLPNSFARDLGAAIGTYALAKGSKRMTVGKDCRRSSERLHKFFIEGLLSTGMNVTDIGLVPTPLLYFSLYDQKSDGGVMVTGSHNPGEHNGFKICVGKASVYGEAIQDLKRLVLGQKFSQGKGTFNQVSVIENYLDYVYQNVSHPLGVKVVVDSGNGMGGGVGPALLKKLGCDVIEMYSEPNGDFPNHHPDPTVLENLLDLQEKVAETGADLGIAFDGDADRIGVVDKSGRVIYGDELLILYARDVLTHFPGATIISEVKASHRFFNDVRLHGGEPLMWKTGHSLIKSKMKELDSPLAGEMSGHMFFNDRYFGYDDAIYAAARIVEIVAREHKTPAQLLHDVPSSFATPEIRVDCPDEIKFEVVNRARDHFKSMGLEVNPIDGARIEFKDGWGLVRASNTQPVLVYRFEAQTEARLKEIRRTIEQGVAQFLS